MIQALTPADLVDVVGIDRSAGPYHWSKKQWLSSLEGDRCYQWVETREMAAVAAFSVVFDEANLLNIAVRGDCQGRGIARKLLTQCLQVFADEGIKHCFLEVRRSNRAALQLYTSLGFAGIGERKDYYPVQGGREDALVMLCRLPVKEKTHART